MRGIESGEADPTLDTVERILNASGLEVRAGPAATAFPSSAERPASCPARTHSSGPSRIRSCASLCTLRRSTRTRPPSWSRCEAADRRSLARTCWHCFPTTPGSGAAPTPTARRALTCTLADRYVECVGSTEHPRLHRHQQDRGPHPHPRHPVLAGVEELPVGPGRRPEPPTAALNRRHAETSDHSPTSSRGANMAAPNEGDHPPVDELPQQGRRGCDQCQRARPSQRTSAMTTGC